MTFDGWNQIHARYLWSFGYQAGGILRIMRNLPLPLQSSLRSLLDSLDTYSRDLTCRLFQASRIDYSISRDQVHFHNAGDIFKCVEKYQLDAEYDLGIIDIEFDPETQRRRRVRFNTVTGRIWGMQMQDLLQRFAHHDVPIPYTELDALRVFVVDFCRSFQDVTEQYVRLTIGVGDAARGMLFCITKLKAFDPFGRLIKVVSAAPLKRFAVTVEAKREHNIGIFIRWCAQISSSLSVLKAPASSCPPTANILPA